MLLGEVGRYLKRWDGKLVMLGFVLPPLIIEIASIIAISNNDEFFVYIEYPKK